MILRQNLIKGNEETLWWSFVVSSDAHHKNHALEKPKRAASTAVKLLKQAIDDQKGEGGSNLEDVIAVSKKFQDMGIDLADATINKTRLKLQKEKLQAKMFQHLDTESLFLDENGNEIPADGGEAALSAVAVLKMLTVVQQNDPGAFIRVSKDQSGCIDYIFVSTEEQRKKGSLFGDLRLFDDKHGVSSSQYHLAACTVQTNKGCEAVCFALLGSSNGANWARFVEDCYICTKTTKGKPVRNWDASIADGDGTIHSAIANCGRLHSLNVVSCKCAYHFFKNINAKHRRDVDTWQPIKDAIYNLLKCDRQEQCESMIEQIDKKLQDINKPDLQQKLQDFFNEVVADRQPWKTKHFTNSWNSQSAAESQNSIFEKLNISANTPLFIVLDRLIKLAHHKDGKKVVSNTTALGPTENRMLGVVQKQISKKAWMHLKEQYDLTMNLHVAEQQTDGPRRIFHVSKAGKKSQPRIVQQASDGTITCSCNLSTYQGISCRHIIVVLGMLSQSVTKMMISSRWWIEQPQVDLMHPSPFKDRTLSRAPAEPLNNDDEPQRQDEDVGYDDDEEMVVWPLSFIGASEDDSYNNIFHVDGSQPSIPLKPSERRNELQQKCYSVLLQIGLGTHSMALMDSFEDVSKLCFFEDYISKHY